MDDFSISTLHESKNEYTARLLVLLTPLVIEGFQSIFKESVKICQDNHEETNYLITFQKLISAIFHWNSSIIEAECKRIVEQSHCQHLQDLITLVHIIQIKLLTVARPGIEQKKLEIPLPNMETFIHKMYIHVARKMYKNVYLFEKKIQDIQKQKHNREIEILVQEGIMLAIRESIPLEPFLRAYMDESVEHEVTEEIKEQVVDNNREKEFEQQIQSEISKAIDNAKLNSGGGAPVEEKVENENNSIVITGENIPFNPMEMDDLGKKEESIPEFPNLLDDIEELT